MSRFNAIIGILALLLCSLALLCGGYQYGQSSQPAVTLTLSGPAVDPWSTPLPCATAAEAALPMVDVVVALAPERRFLAQGLLRTFQLSTYPACRRRLLVVGDGPEDEAFFTLFKQPNIHFVHVKCPEGPYMRDAAQARQFQCYPDVPFNLPWLQVLFSCYTVGTLSFHHCHTTVTMLLHCNYTVV
jgi:hypothetical protein